MASVVHPVLGPCAVLPLRPERRAYALLLAAVFVAIAIVGVVILWVWLTQPNADLDARLMFVAIVGPFSIFAVPGQVKSALSPYYAMVGANGFATFGGEPILWSDVIGIHDRTYRGCRLG